MINLFQRKKKILIIVLPCFVFVLRPEKQTTEKKESQPAFSSSLTSKSKDALLNTPPAPHTSHYPNFVFLFVVDALSDNVAVAGAMNVECGAGARESPTTEARATAAAVVCVAKTSEPATTTSTTACIMTAANALSEEEAAAAVGDKETRRLFSVGDVSHANGTISVESFKVATTTSTMTVSSGVKNNEDSEMVSVETLDKSETVVDVSIKNESKNGWKEFRHSEMEMEDRDDEDDEDEGGRLSEENEAMNLCSKDILPMSPAQQQQPLLSAKMRLKKQRIEAEAAALSSRLSSPWSSHESPSPPTTTTADALHQLAEAAERKQVSHKSIPRI